MAEKRSTAWEERNSWKTQQQLLRSAGEGEGRTATHQGERPKKAAQDRLRLVDSVQEALHPSLGALCVGKDGGAGD